LNNVGQSYNADINFNKTVCCDFLN